MNIQNAGNFRNGAFHNLYALKYNYENKMYVKLDSAYRMCAKYGLVTKTSEKVKGRSYLRVTLVEWVVLKLMSRELGTRM